MSKKKGKKRTFNPVKIVTWAIAIYKIIDFIVKSNKK